MKLTLDEVRQRCLKPDEATKPYYARVVTHAASTYICWLMQGRKISPNALTLLSLIVACVSIPLIASFTPLNILLGALCIELYYVLDAVDGQWARLTNQKSLTGAFFDYIINYIIHPPIIIAVAWGVYSSTHDARFLILGFTAAFACLWVLMIWNMRATIILSFLKSKNKAPGVNPDNADPIHQSPPSRSWIRWAFSWMHKLLVFPWFMIAFTVLSIISFFICLFQNSPHYLLAIFSDWLWIYGTAGPGVAFLITLKWILNKDIDQTPEIIS